MTVVNDWRIIHSAMTETIGELIMRLEGEKRMGDAEVARRANLSVSYVWQIRTGKRKRLSLDVAGRLAKAFDAPLAMFQNAIEPRESQSAVADKATPDNSAILDALDRAKDIIKTQMIRLPLRGHIPMGLPFPSEEIQGYVEIPAGEKLLPKQAYVVKAYGDSLIGDHILAGDLIVLDPQPEFIDGDIYAVRIDGEVTLRHVFKEDGRYRLKSSNPHYEDLLVTEGEIIGRMIKLVREG